MVSGTPSLPDEAQPSTDEQQQMLLGVEAATPPEDATPVSGSDATEASQEAEAAPPEATPEATGSETATEAATQPEEALRRVGMYKGAVGSKFPYAHMTLQEIGESIRSEYWKPDIDLYRRNLAEAGGVSDDGTIAKSVKDVVRAEKAKLPAFACSGVYSDKGRAASNLVEPYPYVQVDGDGIPPALAAEVRNKLGKMQGVVLAFISPSGNGVKAIVQLSEPPDESTKTHVVNRSYAAQSKWTAKMLLDPLGLSAEVDTKVATAANLCFISSDPDAVVNTHVEPLVFAPEPKPKREPTQKSDADNAAARQKKVDDTLVGMREAHQSPIVIGEDDDNSVAEKLVAQLTRYALAGGDEPQLYNRNQQWWVSRGAEPPEHMGEAELAQIVAQLCPTVKFGRKGDMTKLFAGKSVLRQADVTLMPDVPALLRVTRAPHLRLDDELGYDLVVKRGYSPETELWLDVSEDAELELELPAEECMSRLFGDRRDVVGGDGELVERGALLADFPLADDPSRANAIAFALSVIVKPSIDNCPMTVFDKPDAGLGSTLIASTLTRIVTDVFPSPYTLQRRSDEELKKAITSQLQTELQVWLLDNVDNLTSQHLMSLVTAPVWRDRLLGGNEMVELRNDTVIAAAGIRPKMSAESTRRTSLVEMRRDTAEPGSWVPPGGWRIPRLANIITGYVAQPLEPEWRSHYLSAFLSMVKGWVNNGCPRADVGMPSFGEWAEIIGGILHNAAAEIDEAGGDPRMSAICRAFQQNRSQLVQEHDEVTESWQQFLQKALDTFGTGYHGSDAGEWSTQQGFSLFQTLGREAKDAVGPDDRCEPPVTLYGNATSDRITALGRALSSQNGRVFTLHHPDQPAKGVYIDREYRFGKGKRRSRGRTWYLQPLDEGEGGE